MKIALIVDSPIRDLPSLVILGMHLCQKDDIICFLVPANLQSEIWTIKPDFVLLNYLRKNNQNFVNHLLKANIQVGVLDTEGGVFENIDAIMKTHADKSNVTSKISCYCVWGRKLYNYYLDNKIYTENQLYLTGTPRTDFYYPPWNSKDLLINSQIQKISKPIVLINSNFPLANPRYLSSEEEIQMMVREYGFDQNKLEKEQQITQTVLLNFAKLTNTLAEKFPEVQFVYRPHPFEKVSTYNNLLNLQKSNLILTNEGTVDEWIRNASCVIQRNCSTGIEACFAGVPTLSPQWLDNRPPVKITECISIPCYSQDELVNNLKEILSGVFCLPNSIQSNLKNIIDDWYCSLDGHSHERVTNAILKSYQENVRKSSRYCFCGSHHLLHSEVNKGNKVPLNLSQAMLFPIKSIFRPFHTYFFKLPRWDTSGKKYNSQNVQDIIDAIGSMAERNYNYKWKNIHASPIHKSTTHESKVLRTVVVYKNTKYPPY